MAMTVASPAPEALPRAIELTSRVARTFAPVIRFLPAAVRDDVYVLYLICRTLDDLVDLANPDARRRVTAVKGWAEGSGATEGPEAGLLEWLTARNPDLPRDAIRDFCLGQLDELDGAPIQTEADLDRHGYRVAGTVGMMMAGILGVSDPAAGGGARALGIAMQRTNILRDIDEDLRRGRIYIPSETLRAAGVKDLAHDSRVRLLELEIERADRWYDTGLAAIPYLLRGQTQVKAAALMYREILRQLEREGLGRARPSRVCISTGRKVWLTVRAALS